jgi:hypothetical protein
LRVIKREKRACKTCEEQGVESAALPARIIDKSLARDNGKDLVALGIVVEIDKLFELEADAKAGRLGAPQKG